MTSLRERQTQLVRALVARGPLPDGLDATRAHAAIHALLRKRASEVAWHWPVLMADAATHARFLTWADGRPKTSSFEDGLAFARDQRDRGGLPRPALDELRRNEPRRRFRHRRGHPHPR